MHDTNAYLDDWRNWPVNCLNKPEILDQLPSGTSDHNLIITDGEQKWVLCCFNTSPTFHADRSQEFRIQNAAWSADLSPPAVFLDPNHRYLLSDFVAGFSKQFLDDSELQILTTKIIKLQAIDYTSLELQAFDYIKIVDGYWRRLSRQKQGNPDWYSRYKKAAATAQRYQSTYGARRCLTHHDLVADNILWYSPDKQTIDCALIDWEFAGLGIGSFDYATLSVELNIDLANMATLCAYSMDELSLARELYSLVCELYNAAL